MSNVCRKKGKEKSFGKEMSLFPDGLILFINIYTYCNLVSKQNNVFSPVFIY